MNRVEPDHSTLPPPPLPDVAATALFLDVDGTLVEFASRPDGIAVDASLPSLLQDLAARLDGALAPISGRSLGEIDAFLGLTDGAAAGLHGAEVRDAAGIVTVLPVPVPVPDALSRLRSRATALAAELPGVLVEMKPNAIALHYRNNPDAAAAVREAAGTLLREAGSGHELQAGNHVVELKPAGADKGGAVATLMRSAPFAGRVPWVLGDDLTDEHAFKTADALGGGGIIVGPRRPTAARYALDDPRAARAWLAELAASAQLAGSLS